MKYIRTYESYSFPNSLEPVVSLAHKVIMDKLSWWYNRKGFANYSEEINIKTDMYDESISKNNDFPLEFLNIDLKILAKQSSSTISGQSYFYKCKSSKYGRSNILYGRINSTIAITIYVGETIDLNYFSSEVNSMLKHELLHSYQEYKRILKSNFLGRNETMLANILLRSFYYPIIETKSAKFIYDFYILINKNEQSAYAAEYTVDNNKVFQSELPKLSFEEMMGIINKDLNNHKINSEKLTSNFIELLKDNMDEPSSWIRSFYGKDFNGVMGILYKMFKQQYPKFKRKLHKIDYSKSLKN